MNVRWHIPVLLAVSLAVGVRPSAGEVRLGSDPPGTWVSLDGPTFVSGPTPLPIETLPEGRYLLLASGPGVAGVRARIQSRAGENLTTTRLVPPGSVLLPPGSQHIRSKEYWRGSVFFGSGLTGGVGLGYAEAARRDASDELRVVAATYNAALSEGAIDASFDALVAAQQKEDDKTTVRNLWAGYLAGVWVGSAFETWATPRLRLFRDANGDYVLGLPRVNTWSAVWRAALVPGAGQRYLGRSTRSNVTAFSTYFLLAASLFAYDELLDARRVREVALSNYASSVSESDLLRNAAAVQDAINDVNRYNTWRWSLLAAAIAAHTWGIVDSWQVASYSRTTTPEPSGSDLSFSILPNTDGIRAAVAWRLP